MYAWRAQKSGDSVTILESGKSTGGVLQSKISDGFLLDYGANTLSLRSKYVSDLLEELGILGRAIEANPEANLRFIVKNGKLVSLPHGLSSFLTSSFLSPFWQTPPTLRTIHRKGPKNDETADFFPQAGKRSSNLCG